MKGVKSKEIVLSLADKVGELGRVTSVLKENGINIRAIAGWTEEDKAFVSLVTSDNQKANELLSSQFDTRQKEVVVVDMANEAGQLDSLCSKLKDAGIGMRYAYGTTAAQGQPATFIFSSADNDKAIEALSQ